MASKEAALRKRVQIAKANRTMFIWVAIASVVVSAAAVVLIMLMQKGLHNQKAISELGKTVKVLRANNSNVGDLENEVRALGSNQSLMNLRTSEGDNALRVVLDALPAEPNPAALGASLQTRLFEGVAVENMQVMPVDSFGEEGEQSVIGFRFSVKGDAVQLKELLQRLERSIRTIQLSTIKIESAGNEQMLTVEGEAYYQPAVILELRDKEVKR